MRKVIYNSAFSKTDPLIKRKRMIHFFASMELLERASLMLGTITSTPCLVLGIRKLGNVHWVDFEKNEFFPSIDYSIAKKKTLTVTIFEEEINDVERFHGMIAIF